MRCGYTTGTCAAAAAKAATQMLLSGGSVKSVEVELPDEKTLVLSVIEPEKGNDWARCAVIKDAGDDVDVTDGIKVYATVRRRTSGIDIDGGEGIGTVTYPGLSVEPGKKAINPVPKKMIEKNVKKACEDHGYDCTEQGLSVLIEIPEGEKIAGRTFNPRLGIEGGISVLGTTGIVRPMSREALIKSQLLELSVLTARLKKRPTVCFVPGNYGADFAKSLGVADKLIVRISNYVGDMLDGAVELGVGKILLVGDLGKLIKISAGIFQTHSRVSDARLEILSAYAASLGASTSVVRSLLESKTTVTAVKILRENGLDGVFEMTADKTRERVRAYCFDELEVQVVLFSRDYGLLAKTPGVDKALEELDEEEHWL